MNSKKYGGKFASRKIVHWRKKRKGLKKQKQQEQQQQEQQQQQPTEQCQESAPPLTYREWVNSLSKTTAGPDGENFSAPSTSSTSDGNTGMISSALQPEQLPSSVPSTSSQVHTMTFRDWIAAQTAKKSTDQAPTNSEASAETLSVYLPETEVSDVVIKQEAEIEDHFDQDILATSSTDQPMDTLIVEFPDSSFDQEGLNTSTETTENNDLLNQIKTVRTLEEPDLTLITGKRRSVRGRTKELTEKPGGSVLTSKLTAAVKSVKAKKEPKRETNLPRGRPRKKKDVSTTTEDLVNFKSEGTSTEDLEVVKLERSEEEKRELFFKLCEEFLDESATAAIRLTVNAKLGAGW